MAEAANVGNGRNNRNQPMYQRNGVMAIQWHANGLLMANESGVSYS